MASYGKSTTLIIHSLKVILMSTGVLFIAILLVSNLSLPRVLRTSSLPASELIPNLWSSFSLRGWLRPPYLYFITNAIILTIAASSRLHHQNHHATSQHHHPKVAHHHQHHQHDVISVVQYDPVSIMDVVNSATGSYHYDDNDDGGDVKVVPGEEIVEKKVMVEEVLVNDVINKTIISDHDQVAKVVNPKVDYLDEMSTRRTQTPPPRPLTRQEPVAEFLSSERPPASSRFGHHRRPAKGASPVEGGKALRVARPKKHDTLESTWKAITEGRHIPLTRHLKKSDTWENQGRQINLLDDPPAPVKKSETFKDRTNYSPPPVPTLSKLKKDPSLSQDELNRRVEAFIHKFNEDMRLQRQQSIQQFMEKINRAAY